MRQLIVLLLVASSALAQAPKILKVDPPNWWPSMPAPMLLIQGDNLAGATFTFSDRSLRVSKKSISANGHYVELWLAASPVHAETVRIIVRTAAGQTSQFYIFAPRRNPSEGFAGFTSKDVMYLIMPDRFADGDPSNDGPNHLAERTNPHGWHGGDLRGIIQHLDYLQQLGITTVWITPIDQNHEADSYHGYGTTDMYAVDEHFGTLDDLKALSAELHARHMKLVLDTVPNHVGPAHPWVTDSPDSAWFHGTLAHHTVAQGEFAPVTNPHAPWRDQHNVTEGWFADILPDLNQENPTVARYLVQNAIWWIEQAGIDGLRIDTFPYIARPFWHDFHAQLHSLYPHLTTVGEVFNGDPAITSTFAGGVTRTGMDTGLDTPFDFPTYFAIRDVFLKDAPMTKLAEVLRLDNLFPHPERLVPFLGNHDTSRFLNDPAATPQKLELAFALLTTMRGMPQIYSGDEVAMRGGDDPDNRRDFPGGFGPSSPNAFTREGRTREQQDVFAALQRLLALRQKHPSLQTGDEQVIGADADGLFYVRTLITDSTTEHILVALNKSKVARSVVIETDRTVLEGLQHASVLLGVPGALTIDRHTLTLHMEPEAASIIDVQ